MNLYRFVAARQSNNFDAGRTTGRRQHSTQKDIHQVSNPATLPNSTTHSAIFYSVTHILTGCALGAADNRGCRRGITDYGAGTCSWLVEQLTFLHLATPAPTTACRTNGSGFRTPPRRYPKPDVNKQLFRNPKNDSHRAQPRASRRASSASRQGNGGVKKPRVGLCFQWPSRRSSRYIVFEERTLNAPFF